MSRPSESELHRLRKVAGEIVANLEAHGFNVKAAVDLHSSFRDGRGPVSALERALVRQGAQQGARKAAMFPEPVSGGLELVSIDGMTMRRYRLKTLTYRHGEPYILCGEGSSLISGEEEPSLYKVERWILACGTDGDHTIERVLAAEIVDHEGDGPVHLILGPIYDLDPIHDPSGFSPDEDDDLGEDFERGEDTGDQASPEAV